MKTQQSGIIGESTWAGGPFLTCSMHFLPSYVVWIIVSLQTALWFSAGWYVWGESGDCGIQSGSKPNGCPIGPSLASKERCIWTLSGPRTKLAILHPGTNGLFQNLGEVGVACSLIIRSMDHTTTKQYKPSPQAPLPQYCTWLQTKLCWAGWPCFHCCWNLAGWHLHPHYASLGIKSRFAA